MLSADPQLCSHLKQSAYAARWRLGAQLSLSARESNASAREASGIAIAEPNDTKWGT
jgi:hypothetical protein